MMGSHFLATLPASLPTGRVQWEGCLEEGCWGSVRDVSPDVTVCNPSDLSDTAGSSRLNSGGGGGPPSLSMLESMAA